MTMLIMMYSSKKKALKYRGNGSGLVKIVTNEAEAIGSFSSLSIEMHAHLIAQRKKYPWKPLMAHFTIPEIVLELRWRG